MKKYSQILHKIIFLNSQSKKILAKFGQFGLCYGKNGNPVRYCFMLNRVVRLAKLSPNFEQLAKFGFFYTFLFANIQYISII